MLKASFRSFLSHKGRMILSALAVTLSVAFVAGTLVFTATIQKTFDELFKSTAADVSVSPDSDFDAARLARNGQTPTLPTSLVDQLKQVDGVKSVQPDISVENITVVDRNNKNVGATSGAPTLGTNWYESDRSPVKMTSGVAPQGPAETVIDADTAKNKKVKVGDSLRVIAPPGSFEVKVVGIATFTTTNPGAALFFMDTASAQTKMLGKPDVATTLSIEAKDGVSDDELKQRVAQTLGSPEKFEIKTNKEAAKDAASELGQFLDVIKYALLGFAGIAVLVGVFLIFNTFSMLVAQRTRELGLMRAIGASKKDVNRSVLYEALLLGVVGSTLGFVAGLGLAAGLKALISNFGMNLKGTSLVITAGTPITAYIVGIVVTVLAAYIPARRASRVSPMAALRESGAPPQKSLRVRSGIGAVIGLAGAGALAAGATSDSGATGGQLLGLGVLLTLISFVVLGPALAKVIVPALSAGFPRMFGPMGALSRQNALRNPRRTGATAAALMIGVSLVAGLSVVASSLSGSFDKEIDRALGSDYTIQSMTGTFTPEIADAVKKTPGVGLTVREYTSLASIKGGDGKPLQEEVFGSDPGMDKAIKTTYVEGSGDEALRKNQAIVPENWAKDRGLKIGSEIEIAYTDGPTVKVPVGAIRKEAEGAEVGNGNAIIVSADSMVKDRPGAQIIMLFADAADGQDAKAVGESIKTSLDPFPQVKSRDQSDYKELFKKQINGMLYMIYGLLALAIIIAILGVVNTLALSVVERTREIGMMRALGTSRRQIRRMIRLESLVIAVFGAVIGLALGMAWGIAAQRVLATAGLNVLVIPWGTIITVAIASAVVGLLAALMPALRASRLNILNAIASEG